MWPLNRLQLKEWDVIEVPALKGLGESPVIVMSFKDGVNTKGLKLVSQKLFENFRETDRLNDLTRYAAFRSVDFLKNRGFMAIVICPDCKRWNEHAKTGNLTSCPYCTKPYNSKGEFRNKDYDISCDLPFGFLGRYIHQDNKLIFINSSQAAQRDIQRVNVKVVAYNLPFAIKEAFEAARPIYSDVTVTITDNRAVVKGRLSKHDKEVRIWANVTLPPEAFNESAEFKINPFQFVS